LHNKNIDEELKILQFFIIVEKKSQFKQVLSYCSLECRYFSLEKIKKKSHIANNIKVEARKKLKRKNEQILPTLPYEKNIFYEAYFEISKKN
jgi:uncharacterized protein YutD